MKTHTDTAAGTYIVGPTLAARLANTRVEDWRFSEDDAGLVLDALLCQAEVESCMERVQTLYKKLVRLNRLNAWNAVVWSAFHFAVFMVEDRFGYAVSALMWTAVAAMWVSLINKESTREQT